MKHLGWASGLLSLFAVEACGAPPLLSSTATVVDLATGACMALEAGAPIKPGAIDPHVVGRPVTAKAANLKLDPSAVLVPSADGAVYYQVVGPRCQVRAEGVDPAAVERGVEEALAGKEVRKPTPHPGSVGPDRRSISYAIGDLGLPRIPAITVESARGGRSVEVSVTMMRQINLTTDSTPGWEPSDAQSDQAVATIRRYLTAEDTGSTEEAYRMLDNGFQGQMTLADFVKDRLAFRSVSGPVIERRIVRVTWTKDPAQAPYPGIYAATDLVSRFQGIDRHCGYVVAYQRPEGGPFVIMREQSAYMANDQARQIAASQSQKAVDQLWSQLSATCPNFPAGGG